MTNPFAPSPQPPPAAQPTPLSGGGIAADALLAARARTRLVTDPDHHPQLSTYRETDARTALTRGLAEYLQDREIDLPGGRQIRLLHVYSQWPEPEETTDLPALACIPFGDGKYDFKSLTPQVIPAERIAAPDGRWLMTWAELEQDIDVEIHASDPAEREGLMALAEDAFGPYEWMSGFRLMLPHYFGQTADYLPLTIGYPDTADTAIQRQRIVQFRVRAQIGVLTLQSYKTWKAIETKVVVTVGQPDVDP